MELLLNAVFWLVMIISCGRNAFQTQHGSFVFPHHGQRPFHAQEPKPPDPFYPVHHAGIPPPDPFNPVHHAGIPRQLTAYPLPLQDSDHELMFNVSWVPPLGPPAKDYSIEIECLTDTDDCRMRICYVYDIPGHVQWWMVPSQASSIPEACAIRPGCAYLIRLIAHPWDGHTSANVHVALDECVAGICSCAHAPRLPTPMVRATAVSVHGEIFVNVSWTLPLPQYPQRLPKGLNKQQYFVSIGKQLVSDAHPAPWYDHAVYRKVDTDGPVAVGDGLRWLLLPITDRIAKPHHEDKNTKSISLDVKLLARVSVIDDRGCVGPVGNATAYDPNDATNRRSSETYSFWAILGVTSFFLTIFALVVLLRVLKRVLYYYRPTPIAMPLEPLMRRPAWSPRRRKGSSQVNFN